MKGIARMFSLLIFLSFSNPVAASGITYTYIGNPLSVTGFGAPADMGIITASVTFNSSTFDSEGLYHPGMSDLTDWSFETNDFTINSANGIMNDFFPSPLFTLVDGEITNWLLQVQRTSNTGTALSISLANDRRLPSDLSERVYSQLPNYTGSTILHSEWVQAATVPMPAAAWLFGSGLIGLIGIARRKKT